MSKTVSSCLCETNQVPNQPQENVFFHTLYRTQADFPNEFLRTARSTSPIQICALFSVIGPDNLGAVLNLELNKELTTIVAASSNRPVLDFESFSNQVINVLNLKVCNFVISKGGTPLKVSMTMLVIEGDTLRVISVGNTKAVLIRDNRIMSLTEEQTVAHRYVQMGAITAEQEKNHPESMNLTQYLGKLPQDGPVLADKQVHLKLKDNDELCLMGLGLSKSLPAQMRNMILVRPTSTEVKVRELINSAYQYGIMSGLTVIITKVESTFLLPGDAYFAGAQVPVQSNPYVNPMDETKPYAGEVDDNYDSQGDTTVVNTGDYKAYKDSNEDSEAMDGKKKNNEKLWNILYPIIFFLGFTILGFGLMFVAFNITDLIDFSKETKETDEQAQSVMYVVSDNTPLFASDSVESTVLSNLMRGESLIIVSQDDTFSNVITTNNITGYVLTAQISTEDPTINETLPIVESEVTPVATESQDSDVPPVTDSTTVESTSETVQQTTTTAATTTTESTSEETTEETTSTTELEETTIESSPTTVSEPD